MVFFCTAGHRIGGSGMLEQRQVIETVGKNKIARGHAGLHAHVIDIEAIGHASGRGIGGQAKTELDGFAGVRIEIDDIA